MWTKHLIFYIATVVFLLGFARAQADDDIKLALIADKAFDLHKSPLVSLLEVKLSQREGIQLLERAQIDKILQEQRLQLLFSAGGVGDRIAAGGLLKADLLVLLRGKEENEVRQLDIILAETAMGLRLLARTIVWSDDPLSDVEKISEFISWALEKYKVEMHEICAVPPFVSNDLSHQYDYLQTAYARLIEQTLLQCGGIVVVEIEEARAIAQELALAGTDFRVERRLPLYILGEYRNDGIKHNRRTSIKLTLQRGHKLLQTVTEENLPTEKVARFLHEQIPELLRKVSDKKLSFPESAFEAKLLARRADEFVSIAAWKEALAMLEASLLLDPNQPDLHYNAVYVLSQLTSLYYDPYDDIENFTQKAAIGLNYYELGLRHLESFLRSNKVNSHKHMNFMSDFWAAARNIQQYSRCPAEIQATSSEIAKEKREMLFRVMTAKAQTGQLDDSTADLFSNYLFLNYGMINETCKDNYADRLRAIQIIRSLPKARNLTFRLARYQISPLQLEDPMYEEFIAQIATVPSKKVKAGAEDVRRWRDKELAIRRSKPHRPPAIGSHTVASKPDDIFFKVLDLTWQDSSGKLRSFNSDISGWLACGDSIDFVWRLKEIYLMKEKGRLKRIYQSNERFFNIINPCYDGKYVWVPIKRRRGSLVLVVDPITEEIMEFTSQDGLPPIDTRATSVGLAVGEISLAAGLRGRGWCTILKICETGEKTVEVIHEARQSVIEHKAYREAGLNPYLAFSPRFMKVVSDPQDKSKKLMIVGRSTNIESASRRPLIINLETHSVNVLPDTMPTHILDDWLTCHEGALYWVYRGDIGRQRKLWRISFNNLKKTAVATGLPGEGFVVFTDSAIHIVGEHWWMAKDFDDKFIQLEVKFPGGAWYYRKLCYSNHYGLLIISNKRPYQVEFNRIPTNSATPQKTKEGVAEK